MQDTDFFKQTEVERIHFQEIFIAWNVKGSSLKEKKNDVKWKCESIWRNEGCQNQ